MQDAAEGENIGMAKIAVSTMVNRPPETVWKFIFDPSNAPKYDPDIINAKQTSDGPVAVGTTFEANRKKEGKVTFRTLEYDPGRKLTWVVTSPRAMEGSKESIILEDVGGKSKVTNAWDLKLGGFYRLMGPFVARTMRKTAGAQASNIKRILETEAPS
jgi:carbon monoxide dehydrogenase subunit G